MWDALVRSLHWLLVVSVITAWISGHWPPRWFDAVHHGAGYLAAGVVGTRLVWGFVGGRYARFAQFVRSPRMTWSYARQLRAGSAPRYVGHNPLGGWMVLALLASVAAASLTGFLHTTAWLWGYEWLADLHGALAWMVLGLVFGHVGGVAFTSVQHAENLVASMFHGRKRAAASDDVDEVSGASSR